MSLALATLTVLSIAADATAEPPRLAVVDAAGAVLVTGDAGSTWHMVHQCDAPDGMPALYDSDSELEFASEVSCPGGPVPAAIAWVHGSLYLACSGDAVLRWDPGASAAQPAGLAVLPGAVALGSRGGELLIAGEDDSIWSYRPEHLPVRVAGAPERVVAIAGAGAHVAIAGVSAVWQWAGRHFTPLSTARACALAVTTAPDGDVLLWIAGGHGLIALHRGGSTVRSIAPVTGIAIAGDIVLVADGHGVLAAGPARPAAPDPLPAPAPFTATAPPGSGVSTDVLGDAAREEPAFPAARLDSATRIDWSDLSRRARRARWIPRLTVGLTYRRGYHVLQNPDDGNRGNRAVEVWLWLAWPFINREALP